MSVGGKNLPYLKATPYQKDTIAKHAEEHSFQMLPVISAFSKAILPVTIDTGACACLKVVW